MGTRLTQGGIVEVPGSSLAKTAGWSFLVTSIVSLGNFGSQKLNGTDDFLVVPKCWQVILIKR